MNFELLTEHPLAEKSLDHLYPLGTMRDNSRWHEFNRRMYTLNLARPLFIMDLGCAGGGFVKDCLDDGQFAIGLEGSDFSKKLGRAEWATIPNNLFTCDITKPFTVLFNRVPAKFDFITAWEVMEHIEEHDLPQLMANIKNHLNGFFICSISLVRSQWQGQEMHRTIHDKAWWLSKFTELGFENDENIVEYFKDNFVRGPNTGELTSFHLALK